MAPESYKVVITHAHRISGWTIIFQLIHSRGPHHEGMNGDVHSFLATLAFKNIEQLEDFHSRTIRIQQKIILSGETVSPTRPIFQYMKSLLKIDKLKEFIAPNMTYLITLLENNGNSVVYTGGNIHGIYRYIYMIGDPTTLTTSGQHSNNFGPSSSINNDT